LSNSIHDNPSGGILLYGAGNNNQPAPSLTAATFNPATGQATITGSLQAVANTAFLVQFFSNPAGTSQGATYLGSLSVTTDGSGNATFSFTPPSSVAAGLNITATATDPNGNTSQFSAPATVNTATVDVTSDLSVTFGGFVYNRTTRQFTQTLTIANISGSAISGPIELVFLNLKNATLVNQSGTYQGSPYITILSSGSLGVGQSVSITVVFNDPTLAAIRYTFEFLAGPIPTQD